MKQLLSDFNSEEIREALDIPPYKAKQIFRWLAKGCDFAEMSDQSKAFRETLQENYFAQGVKKIKRLVSEDGTEKYLFALNDGAVVEGVLMKYKYGNTLCVSTQMAKYAPGGYLKLWFPEGKNAEQLKKLQAIIADEGQLRQVFNRIFEEEK